MRQARQDAQTYVHEKRPNECAGRRMLSVGEGLGSSCPVKSYRAKKVNLRPPRPHLEKSRHDGDDIATTRWHCCVYHLGLRWRREGHACDASPRGLRSRVRPSSPSLQHPTPLTLPQKTSWTSSAAAAPPASPRTKPLPQANSAQVIILPHASPAGLALTAQTQ
jgi:hypothetical protein